VVSGRIDRLIRKGDNGSGGDRLHDRLAGDAVLATEFGQGETLHRK
jgi:hypothetical protein